MPDFWTDFLASAIDPMSIGAKVGLPPLPAAPRTNPFGVIGYGARATNVPHQIHAAWALQADALRTGVRVLTGPSAQGPFAQYGSDLAASAYAIDISGVPDTTDTYVQVICLGANGTQSAPALTHARAKDTTGPGPVVFNALTTSTTGVGLSWSDPADADYDHVVVSRSVPGLASGYATLVTLNKGTTTYADASALPGASYYYSAITYDISGNPGGISTCGPIARLVPVASVHVSPISLTLHPGSAAAVVATPVDQQGGALTGRTAVFASTNTAVATVDAGTGVVTAVALGSCSVTATSEGQTTTVPVSVTPVPVASVVVNPPSFHLTATQTLQLAVTTLDAAGNVLTGRTVTVATSNAAIATSTTGGLVTAVGAGTATLTFTSEGISGVAVATIAAVVPPPVPTTIVLSPLTPTVNVGSSQTFAAVVKDQTGTVMAGQTVVWSCNVSSVIVTQAGVFTPRVYGTNFTVTATCGSATASTLVTVPPAPVAPPPAGTFVVRYTGTMAPAVAFFDATGYAPTNGSITAHPEFYWDCNDPAGLFNTDKGYITAHVYGPGTYNPTCRAVTQDPTTLAQTTAVIGAPAPITVAPDTRKYFYCDPVAGSDGNTGLSAGSPVQTEARIKQLLNADNTGLLILRGTKLNVASGFILQNKNMRIADYGDPSLAKPVLSWNPPTRNGGHLIQTQPPGSNFLFDNLTFDSVFTSDAEENGMPFGVYPMGTAIVCRNCTFLNVGYAVQGQAGPKGVYLLACDAPQVTSAGAILPFNPPDLTSPNIIGLRAYLFYGSGSTQDVVIHGCTMADSTREHCIRIEGVTRLQISGCNLRNLGRQSVDISNGAKACLDVHQGTFVTAYACTITSGGAGFGGLGGVDEARGGGPKPLITAQWVVEDSCVHLGNAQLAFSPGIQNALIKNVTFVQTSNGTPVAVVANDGVFNGITPNPTNPTQNLPARTVGPDVNVLHCTIAHAGTNGSVIGVSADTRGTPTTVPNGIAFANNVASTPNLVCGPNNNVATVNVGFADLTGLSFAGNQWGTAQYQHGITGQFRVAAHFYDTAPSFFNNLTGWQTLTGSATERADAGITIDPTTYVASPATVVPTARGVLTTADGTVRGATSNAGAR